LPWGGGELRGGKRKEGKKARTVPVLKNRREKPLHRGRSGGGRHREEKSRGWSRKDLVEVEGGGKMAIVTKNKEHRGAC